MKNILTILFLLVGSIASAQQVKVVQINADWNHQNTRLDLNELKGCAYQFGWLKHQTKSIQNELIAVPVVLIFKDDKLVKKYEAGISLKLNTPFEEIQQEINAIKED